jgi:hypothetical protein
MAGQKELVRVVADEMGVPLETVTVVDRFLAEAGLRTRSKRGRGNTPMTYQDAANLIIATAWEVNPKNAVSLVNKFRSLNVWRVEETALVDPEFLGCTFGEALDNVIEAVPLSREEFSAAEDDPRHMAITVTMYTGAGTKADILLVKEGKQHTFQFHLLGETTKLRDLRRTVQFTQITLGFVGEAIAADLPSTRPNQPSIHAV